MIVQQRTDWLPNDAEAQPEDDVTQHFVFKFPLQVLGDLYSVFSRFFWPPIV